MTAGALAAVGVLLQTGAVDGYSTAEVWLVFVAMGLGTFALRLSFIPLFGRIDEVPPSVVGLLRFVPAAVLAALVAPTLVALSVDPRVGFDYERSKLLAGAVAAVVAWRTKNVLATIVVGMVALWIVRAVL